MQEIFINWLEEPIIHIWIQDPNLDFQSILFEDIEETDEDRVPNEGQDCYEDETNEELPTGELDYMNDLDYDDEILVQESEVLT